jgi:hypothetical protein
MQANKLPYVQLCRKTQPCMRLHDMQHNLAPSFSTTSSKGQVKAAELAAELPPRRASLLPLQVTGSKWSG